MAPGCFTPSAKESSNKSELAVDKREPVETESNNNNSNELVNSSSSNETQATPKLALTGLDCYADEINLDQIPLPLTPPPPLAVDAGEGAANDEHDDQQDQDDEDDDELDLFRKTSEADTFEILEQTIIKQKRLAKLKNTDLRRKVLLKRTFDLVLEIMDAENGFNDDEPDSTSQPATVTIESALELELHPEPTKMDEDDDDDESEMASTTLVKLVDVEAPLVEPDASARVPRQHKRRSSSDEDEEDENQLDETYFYEYSMNHLNDQQLNYRLQTPLQHDSDLKIYSDSPVDNLKTNNVPTIATTNASSTSQSSTRSNHPRKKVKTE